MPFESLEDFIKAADAVGEVQHIEGADLDLDVGGLTELTAERSGPMLVFDKFAGYPAGFRVAANANRRSDEPLVPPVAVVEFGIDTP